MAENEKPEGSPPPRTGRTKKPKGPPVRRWGNTRGPGSTASREAYKTGAELEAEKPQGTAARQGGVQQTQRTWIGEKTGPFQFLVYGNARGGQKRPDRGTRRKGVGEFSKAAIKTGDN